MAWTASLNGRKMVDGVAVLTVAFADDTTQQRFDEQVRVQGTQAATFLNTYVRNRIAQLNQTSAWLATVTEGAITPAADDVVTAPTPEALAQTAWQRKYQRLQAWKRACDVGLESMTDPQFITLRDEVIASRLPGYRQNY